MNHITIEPADGPCRIGNHGGQRRPAAAIIAITDHRGRRLYCRSHAHYYAGAAVWEMKVYKDTAHHQAG